MCPRKPNDCPNGMEKGGDENLDGESPTKNALNLMLGFRLPLIVTCSKHFHLGVGNIKEIYVLRLNFAEPSNGELRSLICILW